MMSNKICEVCFTSSWQPCPEGTPDAVEDGNGGFMICWCCRLEAENERLQLENEQLKFLYLENKVTSEVIEENNRLKRTIKALQVAAISKAIEDSLEGD